MYVVLLLLLLEGVSELVVIARVSGFHVIGSSIFHQFFQLGKSK